MSHITLAQSGMDDVEKRNFQDAIPKLTTALQTSLNPSWLVHRSRALVGTNRYEEALADAELAWHAANARNKRELFAEANYRRGVAYLRLGQYGNAVVCCDYAIRLLKGGTPVVAKEDLNAGSVDENGFCTVTPAQATEQAALDEKRNELNDAEAKSQPGAANPAFTHSKKLQDQRMATQIKRHAVSKMAKLPSDDPARKVTVTQKPEQRPLSSLGQGKENEPPKPTPSAVQQPSTAAGASTSTVVSPPAEGLRKDPRVDDYQDSTTITIAIFSKNVDKARLKVDFQPNDIRLDPIKFPNGEEDSFKMYLWGEIEPEGSKFTVTPSKIELKLKKKTLGKWAAVQVSKPQAETTDKALPTIPEPPSKPEVAPSAPATTQPVDIKESSEPSSANPSKEHPKSETTQPKKNWDKIVDVDSEEEDSDVNLFFKKLYKDANPEQQRAMMKSFIESNGTTLSTDWDDVKERTVETKPPDGVEAKKWD